MMAGQQVCLAVTVSLRPKDPLRLVKKNCHATGIDRTRLGARGIGIQGLTDNPQLRPGHPKLSDATIRDFCSGDLENIEPAKTHQACNSIVGHLRIVERQELEIAQSPEVGQTGIGYCEPGPVQLFEVSEPTDALEQPIGPAIVQIGEHDVAEVIGAYVIDDPSGPPWLRDPRVWAIIPLVVVDDPAAGLIDRDNHAALGLTEANDTGNPAQPAADDEDEKEQPPDAEREKGTPQARSGRPLAGQVGLARGFENHRAFAIVGHVAEIL